ncbi:MAG: hypothetical protein K2G23_10575 [Muribaculaceae bacterium]|nr:hypothetical protein [Muribaculaceae bacterium]
MERSPAMEAKEWASSALPKKEEAPKVRDSPAAWAQIRRMAVTVTSVTLGKAIFGIAGALIEIAFIVS